MSIGLLSMAPINSRSVILLSCWSRTSSLALELEEKPLDSRSRCELQGHILIGLRREGRIGTYTPIKVIGWIGTLLGLALLPPVFSFALAVGPLLPSEVAGLWFGGIVLLLSSLWMVLKCRQIPAAVAAICFGVFCLIAVELGARIIVNIFEPHSRPFYSYLSLITYPQYIAYRGHPFLQFTGNPSSANHQSNKYGFFGKEYPYVKPPNVLRIAALGGSTTADGYPEMLEDFLNEQAPRAPLRFEALNFGLGWYTSAHSVVNFVLNVVDFAPDYVIIHDGWNDNVARDTGNEFRGDYSHALTPFHEPVVPDKYAIRLSLLYRYFKWRLAPLPDWAFLDTATVRQEARREYKPFQNQAELAAFRRNIRTIVDLATLRGITVVLTTQPHTTDPKALYAQRALHFDQCNAIIRELAAEYSRTTVFVDLDRLMTGKMNDVFVDVGHLNEQGRQFKARQIGLGILADSERRAALRRTNAGANSSTTAP